MIKELLFAILLGALLGFGATGTYLTLRGHQTPSTLPQPTTTPNPSGLPANDLTPTPTLTDDNHSSSLIINSPSNLTVVDTATIELRGQSQPNNLIIVQTPIKTHQTETDDIGSFNLDINLESGINPISVVSINPVDNSQDETQIYLTYSTAKI